MNVIAIDINDAENFLKNNYTTNDYRYLIRLSIYYFVNRSNFDKAILANISFLLDLIGIKLTKESVKHYLDDLIKQGLVLNYKRGYRLSIRGEGKLNIKETSEKNDIEISSSILSDIKLTRCFKTNEPICPKDITLKQNQVFNAMPFQEQYFEIYNKVIHPLLKEKGYLSIKSDDEPKTGDLMCHICELIRESQYAIVNISEWNPNVLFELGLIYGLGKTAILLKDRESKELSDLKGMLYIPYKFGFHDKLKSDLSKSIETNF